MGLIFYLVLIYMSVRQLLNFAPGTDYGKIDSLYIPSTIHPTYSTQMAGFNLAIAPAVDGGNRYIITQNITLPANFNATATSYIFTLTTNFYFSNLGTATDLNVPYSLEVGINGSPYPGAAQNVSTNVDWTNGSASYVCINNVMSGKISGPIADDAVALTITTTNAVNAWLIAAALEGQLTLTLTPCL